MYDDHPAENAVPERVDERIDLLRRYVDLEHAHRQATERAKEASAKVDAIRADLTDVRSALTEALEVTGVLPSSDAAVSLDEDKRAVLDAMRRGGVR